MKDKIKNKIAYNYETILISVLLLISILSFFQNLNSIFITFLLIVICFIIGTNYIQIENKKIKLKINKEIRKSVMVLFIFCIYLFLSSKIIDNTQNFISLNSNLFIVLTMTLFTNQEFNYKNVIKPLFIYNCIMTVLLILCIIFNLENDNRGVLNFFSYKYDPNYMCSSFLLLFFIQIKRLFNYKNKFKYLNILIIILFIFLCFLSGSRGITISSCAGIIIYALLSFFRKDKKRKSINTKKIILFVLALVAIIFIIKNVIPQSTLERFQIKNMLSFGGRSYIWEKTIKVFISSPLKNKLFGYGVGSFISVVKCFKYGMYHVSHNIFFNYLIENGIIGLSLIITFIVYVFKELNSKRNNLCIGLLFANLLLFMTLDLNFNFWINIIMCLIIANEKEDEK